MCPKPWRTERPIWPVVNGGRAIKGAKLGYCSHIPEISSLWNGRRPQPLDGWETLFVAPFTAPHCSCERQPAALGHQEGRQDRQNDLWELETQRWAWEHDSGDVGCLGVHFCTYKKQVIAFLPGVTPFNPMSLSSLIFPSEIALDSSNSMLWQGSPEEPKATEPAENEDGGKSLTVWWFQVLTIDV